MPPSASVLQRDWIARSLAWALGVTTAAQVGFAFVLGIVNGLDLAGFFARYIVAMSTGALAFALVGALIVTRQRGNVIGWLFCAIGVGFGTGWMTEYAQLGLIAAPGTLPGADIVNWVNRWLWMPLVALVAVYLPLLFPTGRLLSARWRLLAWLAALAATAMAVSFAIQPDRIDSSQPDVPNPFAPGWAPMALPVLGPVALVLEAASLAGGVLAAVVRFRSARSVERQQLKWFAYAVGVLVLALVGPLLIGSLLVGFRRATQDTMLSGAVLALGFPAIPIATGLAILRYGLFDIDLLISRTLVYGALTLAGIGVYTFVVGYLGTVLRSGDNLLISLAATGLVAVLFQALREQLQRAVTRLLYGQRDEPYAVLSRLDHQLASSLTPDTVVPIMVREIRNALRLSSVAISVQAADGEEVLQAASGEPNGEVMRLPLTYQGEVVGALSLGPRAPGEALTTGDIRLLQDLARHAGAAIHAVRLTAELRRSRERLVLAREEERRRMRRDLHDELAPTLAGLGLVAASVERLIPLDAARALEAARALPPAIRQATGEVRRLAYDLRPPALDQLGLVGALRERVAQLNSGADSRQTTPSICLEVSEPLPALPAAVEVAAYRIAQEALMNVVRHAGARACLLRLAKLDREQLLELEIRDDGEGLPDEGLVSGVGLRSMRERAEELGGECRVERLDEACGGTRVVARLPLARSYGAG